MMGELVSLLHEGGYSLVLQKDGKIHTFSERGVADLYRLRSENPELLQGAFLADKVVGKGAAALMILGRVAELHADVISEPALSLLAESPVRVSYGEKVPSIRNRARTGFCPLETLCKDAKTATQCLPLIDEFINSMKK